MGILGSLKKMFAGNARYYHDMLGLAPDEDFQSIVSCNLWRSPTSGENLEAAALQFVGLFTGHTVQQVGVTGMVALTTTGRLVVKVMLSEETTPMSFLPGTGHALTNTGRFAEETIMGPSGRYERGVIYSLTQGAVELFQVIVPESKAGEIPGWR